MKEKQKQSYRKFTEEETQFILHQRVDLRLPRKTVTTEFANQFHFRKLDSLVNHHYKVKRRYGMQNNPRRRALTSEESDFIFECRNADMTWHDIAEKIPGQTAKSIQYHYEYKRKKIPFNKRYPDYHLAYSEALSEWYDCREAPPDGAGDPEKWKLYWTYRSKIDPHNFINDIVELQQRDGQTIITLARECENLQKRLNDMEGTCGN